MFRVFVNVNNRVSRVISLVERRMKGHGIIGYEISRRRTKRKRRSNNWRGKKWSDDEIPNEETWDDKK